MGKFTVLLNGGDAVENKFDSIEELAGDNFESIRSDKSGPELLSMRDPASPTIIAGRLDRVDQETFELLEERFEEYRSRNMGGKSS